VSVVCHPSQPSAHARRSCNYRYFEAQARRRAQCLVVRRRRGPDGRTIRCSRTCAGFTALSSSRATPARSPVLSGLQSVVRSLLLPQHRDETAASAASFYDYLDADGFGESQNRTPIAPARTVEQTFAFMHDAGLAFIDAYFPILERRASEPFGARERRFSSCGRGPLRRVQPDLRPGDAFRTAERRRTESILDVAAPLVRWSYDEQPNPAARRPHSGRTCGRGTGCATTRSRHDPTRRPAGQSRLTRIDRRRRRPAVSRRVPDGSVCSRRPRTPFAR